MSLRVWRGEAIGEQAAVLDLEVGEAIGTSRRLRRGDGTGGISLQIQSERWVALGEVVNSLRQIPGWRHQEVLLKETTSTTAATSKGNSR